MFKYLQKLIIYKYKTSKTLNNFKAKKTHIIFIVILLN